MDSLFEDHDPAIIRLQPEDLLAMWNDAAHANNMRGARELTDARRRRCRKLLAGKTTRDYWQSVIDRVVASGFCTGRIPSASGRLWRADFDFLTRAETHTKVLEGKYDDGEFQRAHKAADRGRAVVYDETIAAMDRRRISGGH